MVTEEAIQDVTQLLCLRVRADCDPGALTRVVSFFQTLNVVPRRVLAEFGSDETLHIRVDVAGLPEYRLSLIAAKIGEIPAIENAYWHHL